MGFYPVLTEKYAVEIASRWNVKYNDDHKGYVTKFEIDDTKNPIPFVYIQIVLAAIT